MGRRLKEKLNAIVGGANEPAAPKVSVPPTDKAETLVEAAESGLAAIQALYADRNESVKLAQSLHRHNVVLMNTNIALRAEAKRFQTERDHYMKLNATIGAWCANAHDMIARILNAIGHTGAIVDTLPDAPPIDNNPMMPEISITGLPLFDGVPADESLPQDGKSTPYPTADDLRALAQRLNGNH